MANRSEAISGKGLHNLTYKFPTDIYNNSTFVVSAVMDEKDSLNRIAFTNDKNTCRFSIRREYAFNSLVAPFGDIHGSWTEGINEYLVDSNGEEV